MILPGVLPSLASLIPKIAAGHPKDLGPLQVGSFSFCCEEFALLRELIQYPETFREVSFWCFDVGNSST